MSESINLIANILFLPEEFFVTTDSRKGLTALRLAQASQIIDLLNENIAESEDLTTAEREKFLAVLQNLQPFKEVQAPVFEE